MLFGVEARKELFNQVKKSVVAILQEDGSIIGVGFFFSSKPLILTCAHVVKDLQRCVIIRIDNEVEVKENVEVFHRNSDMDVAILEAKESPKSFLSPSQQFGDFGYIFGYDEPNILKMKSGNLLGIKDGQIFGKKPNAFIACHAHQGYFGSPVIDCYGHIKGMVLGLKDKSFLSSTRFLPTNCLDHVIHGRTIMKASLV